MRKSRWIIAVAALSLALTLPTILGTRLAQTAGTAPTDLAAVSGSTLATVITVTTTDDELNNDGDCSLREAVQAANTDTAVDACPAGSGDDTIVLPANTYTLSIGSNEEDGNAEGDLDVTGVLTIAGAGATTTIVQGGTNAFNGIDRVFHVLDSSSLTVQDMTIRYGRTVSGGSPHINGGGIYVAHGGLLNISNSTLANNRGSNGGAICSSSDATVNINNSTISNNNGGSAGGGLRSLGIANVNNTAFHGNCGDTGGAINVWIGTVNVMNSTFSGNGAGYGGGAIQSTDVLIVNNSTFSGNTANSQGGGIRNFGTVHINNSTFTGNGAPTGGGILNLGGTVTATNSIIANNTGGDCSGAIVSGDYNIDSDNTCSLTQTHDLPNTNPLLGSLADNGGPTWTHALQDGSPAVDAGDCSGGTITQDQRGAPRPQGTACDIGAYERGVLATDDDYETPEDTTLIVAAPGVLTNDRDDRAINPLTATVIISPTNGTLVFSTDGSFTYTPPLNFNGVDGFTYITGDDTFTDTATVNIIVVAVNDAPVAMGDAYTTTEDIALTIPPTGLLGNDSDIESDPLQLIAATNASSGTVTTNIDGSFVYTPTSNFYGVDCFTYTISDGTLTDTATVTITVAAVNDSPIAVEDAYTTSAGIPLTVVAPGVLENDSDVEAASLTAVLKTLPMSGTLTLNLDGSLVYTPTAGFVGEDQFAYCANDGSTDSASVPVTIHVVRHWLYLPIALSESQ